MENLRLLAPRLLLLAAVVTPLVAQRGERLAPYVPSPQPVVDRMLEAAEIKPGEIVYDLGCGDGRVVITAARDFKAKSVGVELSEPLVKQAQDTVRRMNLQNRVSIVQGDLMEVDLKPADVVTLYLLTSSNDQLKPMLEKSLRAGARVVSHDFVMRGWKPVRTDSVWVSGRTHNIYVYQMPPVKTDGK